MSRACACCSWFPSAALEINEKRPNRTSIREITVIAIWSFSCAARCLTRGLLRLNRVRQRRSFVLLEHWPTALLVYFFQHFLHIRVVLPHAGERQQGLVAGFLERGAQPTLQLRFQEAPLRADLPAGQSLRVDQIYHVVFRHAQIRRRLGQGQHVGGSDRFWDAVLDGEALRGFPARLGFGCHLDLLAGNTPAAPAPGSSSILSCRCNPCYRCFCPHWRWRCACWYRLGRCAGCNICPRSRARRR